MTSSGTRVPPEMRSRWVAMQPGGPITRRFFATQNTVMTVGGTVFVHGGLLPHHVEFGLARINSETATWMVRRVNLCDPEDTCGAHLSWSRSAYGTDADVCNSDDSLMPKVAAEDDPETRTRKTPGFLRGKNALVWSRHFSSTKEACQCELLDRVLSMVGASGASRMVVGKSYTKDYIIIVSSHILYRHVMMCARGCDGLFGLLRFPHAHRINPSSVFTIQLHRHLHFVLTCTPVRLT